jgi:LDH2 family malate/lactate/ureidoglycolate dehydrogenase
MSTAAAGYAVAIDELSHWTQTVLESAGASPASAEATAAMVVHANRRGLDSHGVVMLAFYLRRLARGTIDGSAVPEVIVDLPAAALVDGHNGLGAYVGSWAMNLACKKAKGVGTASVAVRNSSHFGAASFFAEIAASSGCIGIVFSNSDPGMAPRGAHGPVLGTNPLAIAAPSSDGLCVPSLDIATSVVAQGRIILAQRAGESIPDSWAIGPDGEPTTDPAEALQGAVLPMADYKGFALAFMIDILSGCLTGALISPDIEGDPESVKPQRTGHLFICIDVERVCSRSDYESALRRLADAVHTAPRNTAADPFLIPGEREARAAEVRRTEIPFDAGSVGLLRALGEEFGVPAPFGGAGA